jgi:aspartyl-tRNA(Asn)/glutamyl-tRNA(Gln) amidotransferase subunit B
MNYKPVIGLEVHVELNTKSKMFCSCSADYFGKAPNTHTCPVCLGFPGALPFANEEAIKKCIQIGQALNCSISEDSLFERKNYFYPDLAKGYQISQLRWPLCVGGWIDVKSDNGEVSKIRINRVHQEEDTGKLTHTGGETLIDYNRSSVPLTEIVTEPDFTDSSQIRDYAKRLQQIFRYLGVSNADMEKGDMRLEANISVRPEGQTELPPYRVELKNINSFRFMVAAVEYEIKRQIKALEAGEKLTQETRGWDETKKQTFLQRSKEEANDYRYFPEPDLPRIKNLESRVKELQEDLPELPVKKIERYIKEYGISEVVAETLVGEEILAELFDGAVKLGNEENVPAKEIANYLANQKLDPIKVSPDEVVQAVKEKKSGRIEDKGELSRIAEEVIKENEQSVNAYKSGKESAIQALIGGMMRKTEGKADAGKAKEILESLLKISS